MNLLIFITLCASFMLFVKLDYRCFEAWTFYRSRCLKKRIKGLFREGLSIKLDDELLFYVLISVCVFLLLWDLCRFSLQNDAFLDYFIKDGAYLHWVICLSILQLTRAIFGKIDWRFKKNTSRYKLVAEYSGLAGFIGVAFALFFNINAFFKVGSEMPSEPFGNKMVQMHCQKGALFNSVTREGNMVASDGVRLFNCNFDVIGAEENSNAELESEIKVILSIISYFFVQLAVDLKIRLARVDYEKSNKK